MATIIWVAEIGVRDTEFLAGGSETDVSLHRTRDGAVAAVRARFAQEAAQEAKALAEQELGIFQASLEIPISEDGADGGELTESHFGEFTVGEWELGEWELADEDDNVRFVWNWSIYPKTVGD